MDTQTLAEVRRGKGKSTVRHGYSDTVKKLGFTSNELSEWLPAAKDRSLWGGIVEFRLNLAPGTYTKYKLNTDALVSLNFFF